MLKMAFVIRITLLIILITQAYLSTQVLDTTHTPTQDRSRYFEPVIFEPKRRIKLSRSTYKVTSYVEFTPYLQAFKNYETYLIQFQNDINNPNKVGQRIRQWQGQDSPSKRRACYLLFSHEVHTYKSSRNNYECRLAKQYDKNLEEVQNLRNLYEKIRDKFLSAIDHLDYHPTYNLTEATSTTVPPERKKRSIKEHYDKLVFQEKSDPDVLRGQYVDLSLTEEKVLMKIVEALRQVHLHPKIKEAMGNQTRVKRFAFMSWLLGWGVYSNTRNIKAIKENIKILQEQNILQQDQILELTHYLNLTMVQVGQHRDLILELDTKLEILNKTLYVVMGKVDQLQYSSLIMRDIRANIAKLTSGMVVLKHDVESVYEYMRVLSSHLVNPLILPPENLRQVLIKVKYEMRKNPRLELPNDPDTDIWTYYSIMKITPIVQDDFLVIILTIPLMDKSLQMDLYQVHNLPALHPSLGVQFTYVLEGPYLAISKHGQYAAVPTAHDIQLCLTTNGHLCMMNQALYPVDKIEWCVYALYTNNYTRIQKHCMVDSKARHANMAVSLDGYMWAVSSLITERIQIRCLTETDLVEIKPPLTIISVGNGCEGYSSNIYIPAKTELTSQIDTTSRQQFFLGFNEKYQNLSSYGMWQSMTFETLTDEEKLKIQSKLKEFPPMVLNHLKKRISLIDEDYPMSISAELILIFLVAYAILGIILIIIFLICMYKLRTRLGKHKKLLRGFSGLTKGNETKPVISVVFNKEKKKQTPKASTSQIQYRDVTPTSTLDRRHPPQPPLRKTPSVTSMISSSTDISSKQLQKAVQHLVQTEGTNMKPYNKYLQEKFKQLPQ